MTANSLNKMADFTLDQIRAWRQERYDAGQPSTFLDFLRVHEICPTCKGRGIILNWEKNENVPCPDNFHKPQ